jgi:hypothetical protein
MCSASDGSSVTVLMSAPESHVSALVGSRVVRESGPQVRPLRGGTSIGAHILLTSSPSWPTGGRVLPRLLPAVDRHIEQTVTIIHRLGAASRRPVRLEDTGFLSEAANEMKQAQLASNQESAE